MKYSQLYLVTIAALGVLASACGGGGTLNNETSNDHQIAETLAQGADATQLIQKILRNGLN